MSKFDDFMIHYKDIDLVDVNSIIFETLSEAGADIDSVETIAPALFARGYVIVEKKVIDRLETAQSTLNSIFEHAASLKATYEDDEH